MVPPCVLLDKPLAATLAIILSVGLMGCTTVKLISDYDDQIDSGVTQILAETTTFVRKMSPLSGTPAGEYDQNKGFYNTEEGKIIALKARAQAHQVFDTCPSTALVAKAIALIATSSSDPSVKRDTVNAVSGNAKAYTDSLSSGDCEVVMLDQLYKEMENLKGFQQANNGIPAQASDPILVGGIGSTVRMIIVVEAAKKNQAKGSAKSGS